MKKILLILATLLIFASSVYAEADIKLIVDDMVIDTDYVTVNDRTLVPVRAVMESTGATVNWNEDYSVDVIKGDINAHLMINSNILTVNGEDRTMDVTPILYNDTTTYVPLRAICEEVFGFIVDWDEQTKTILINDSDGCPYVNVCGLTTDEFRVAYGLTVEKFEEETQLNYEDYADEPYERAMYDMTFETYAKGVGGDTAKLNALLGTNATGSEKYGEVLGEVPLKVIMKVLYGNEYSEEMFDIMCEVYGFGEEYTPDTKYKYVRTIMDTVDMQRDKPQEDMFAIYADKLPELTANKRYFTITLADGRVMKGEIYPDLAKETAQNFIKLCEDGFYNGTMFHRVIDGFMIQCGGYFLDGTTKETEAIYGEFFQNGYINPLKHERGVISMARTNEPNSATSQFFIMDEAAPHLDGAYAAFGRITEGFDVLDSISAVETSTQGGMSDVPVLPVVVSTITVE